MKTSIIVILLIILIFGAGYWIFKPVEPSDSELNLIHQRDSLHQEFKKLQVAYDITALLNSKKEAELLISRAQVKRSEDQLTKSKANERIYLKRIKEQTLAMSDVQADSVIKERFKQDPDSLGQKTVLEFARLDACDSVRVRQDSALYSLRLHQYGLESKVDLLDSLNNISRAQISVLVSSSQIDKQLIQSKDKQLKKLKRRERVLKIIVPVAFVLVVVLMI